MTEPFSDEALAANPWREPLSDDGMEFVRQRVETFWKDPIAPRLELERVPMRVVSALHARALAAEAERDRLRKALEGLREAMGMIWADAGCLVAGEMVPMDDHPIVERSFDTAAKALADVRAALSPEPRGVSQ